MMTREELVAQFEKRGETADDARLVGSFVAEGLGLTDKDEVAKAERLIKQWLGWLNS